MLDARFSDGRMTLREIESAYQPLLDSGMWDRDEICNQRVFDKDGRIIGRLPVYALRTRIRGAAMYVIAGIHGEEPAGPNALARSVDYLGAYAEQGIPMVVMPMANPAGYYRDWRYQNAHRGHGNSIGDADHVLPAKNGPGPRRSAASSVESGYVMDYLQSLKENGWNPFMGLDLHEDDDDAINPSCEHPYLYVYGERGVEEAMAKRVVKILLENGTQLTLEGRTRDGHEVVGGLVANVRDGSIDEFLHHLGAKTVTVVETPINGFELEHRVRAHAAVVEAISELWRL